MNMQGVYKSICENRDEDLTLLKRFIEYPSLTNNPSGICKCVKFLTSLMTQIGIDTEIIETDGNPLIYGELKSSKDVPTILFYGHYDVQPTGALNLWESPPFVPTIRNNRLYGRGSGDNKGQLLAHILAVKNYLKNFNKTPINIKFIFEGEEVTGSHSLEKFAKQNPNCLKADLVYTADGAMALDNTPLINLGTRGVMRFNLEIHTARADNHSGNKGGAIENAAWELVKVLSSMLDNEGNVLIEGFYDDVIEANDEDIQLINKLPFDPGRLADIYNVKSINKNKEEFFKSLIFKPTLTINDINTGYPCCGVDNIIPGRAEAKMEVRLSYNQSPEKIRELIRNHIHTINPYIKIVPIDNDMLPSKTDINDNYLNIISKSIEKATTKKPLVVPGGGPTLPEYIWTEILNIPSIIVPYANIDESNHSPNENIQIDLFHQGIKTTAQIIHDFKNII